MYTVFDASDTFYKTKGTVQELAPLVAKHGIGGINPPAELLEKKTEAKEAAKLISDLGLKWGLMPTPTDMYFPTTTDDIFDEATEKLKIWADTAEQMGIKYSYNHVVPASDEREYEENLEYHIKRVNRVASIMNEHGINYGLEFIGPYHIRESMKYEFIHTIAGIRALAERLDYKVGFVFDTYHWFTGSGDIDDIFFAAANVDKMAAFHLNDGIEGRSAREQQDMERMLPMTTGVIDSVFPYRLFKKAGYEGPVLCEPMFPCYERFPKMAPEEVIAEIADAYKKVEMLAKK